MARVQAVVFSITFTVLILGLVLYAFFGLNKSQGGRYSYGFEPEPNRYTGKQPTEDSFKEQLKLSDQSIEIRKEIRKAMVENAYQDVMQKG